MDVATLLEALGQVPRRLADLERAVHGLAKDVEAIRSSMPSAKLGTADAARHLGISVVTLRRWIRTGKIPSLRIGKVVRVDLSRLTAKGADDIAALARRASNNNARG